MSDEIENGCIPPTLQSGIPLLWPVSDVRSRSKHVFVAVVKYHL